MKDETIAIISSIALAVILGIYLTATLCRTARGRGGWFHAVIGATLSSFLVGATAWLGLSL